MSILIKGMDMPNDGGITVNIYADGVVTYYSGETIGEAVSIPPHGRLIDADALEDEGADVHEDIMCGDYVEDAIWGFSHYMIRNAPTIIPAESEGK